MSCAFQILPASRRNLRSQAKNLQSTRLGEGSPKGSRSFAFFMSKLPFAKSTQRQETAAKNFECNAKTRTFFARTGHSASLEMNP